MYTRTACRALSVHISGMYKQRSVRVSPRTGSRSPLLGRYIPGMYKQRSEAKGTGASKSKKIVIFVRRT